VAPLTRRFIKARKYNFFVSSFMESIVNEAAYVCHHTIFFSKRVVQFYARV